MDTQAQATPAFPGQVAILGDDWLPEQSTPAGYAALVHAYGLKVPAPAVRAAVSPRNRAYQEDGWRVFPVRQMPEPTFAGNLLFALKHEPLDLLVLKKLFEATGPGPVEELVRQAPNGIGNRRAWFLYEWLTGARLDLPDATGGSYAEVVDTELQWGSDPVASTRHRLKDNMPGTPAFCPLVRKTEALADISSSELSARAHEVVAAVAPDVMARAAAFLLLEDSKSSFEIEGERPGTDRIQRWGKALAQAGRRPVSVAELERLQRIVLEGSTHVTLGLRREHGFIGTHDRATHEPLPSHVSAKPEDLPDLMQGLVEYERRLVRTQDPILTAAVLSFGFVFIHPFADGNGRMHRYLIHHVLSESGFSPKGMVFPVSSVMAKDIDSYRTALESYSAGVLPFIRWRPDPTGNVVVEGDTADFYRYFDATPQVEFLYACVRKTIEYDLPEETRFLECHDAFKAALKRRIDLPQRTEDLAFSFLHQGKGTFSRRARKDELAELGDENLDMLERIYADTFGEREAGAAPAP